MVQLFSPIVASQRIMFCQFDNSYTSIQLDDDLNFVFEEVSGCDLKKKKIYHSLIHLIYFFSSFWDFFLWALAMKVSNISNAMSAFVSHLLNIFAVQIFICKYIPLPNQYTKNNGHNQKATWNSERLIFNLKTLENEWKDLSQVFPSFFQSKWVVHCSKYNIPSAYHVQKYHPKLTFGRQINNRLQWTGCRWKDIDMWCLSRWENRFIYWLPFRLKTEYWG